MSYKAIIAYFILFVVAVFPVFCHLDAIPMQLWDESRLADHAMEMIKSHDWIVTRYRGQPDMWMTKPPLMVWLQVACMQLFGFTELSVRLPSALAAVGTCLALFLLFARKFKLPVLGIISVFVLTTTPGYIIIHGTRTGEYDSLLTLFMTAYAFCFFLYMDTDKRKYLLFTFLFLILATLTKGIQGLVFLPALMVYALYCKKLRVIFTHKEFYIGIVAFLVMVAGYYLLREHYNPGFIKTMQENEIGGRYSNVIESHGGNGFYYYGQLTEEYYQCWCLLLICGIFTGLLSKNSAIKKITVFAGIFAGLYLIIISCAQTKVYWYLLPVYPFLAMLVGVALYSFFQLLSNIGTARSPLFYKVVPCVFLVCVFFTPYKYVLGYCLSNKGDLYMPLDKGNMQLFLKEVLHHNINIDGSEFINDDFWQDMEWYMLVFEHEHRPLKLTDRRDINPNSKIVAFMPDSKKFILANYNTTITDTFRNVVVYQLRGKRQL